MARTLIEEFKLENPQYKDVDDGVFKSVIISDFKSQFPQYKDMGDDFFAPMLNPTEKTTMEKAAGGATGLVKKAASAFVPSIPKTPGEALDKTFPPVAIDKKVASVNQDLEESVEKYPLAYNGLDRMNAAMARTPAFAYDVAMLPGNLMRKVMGQPEPQVQSPDWLMNNKVAEFYDESVRQTDYVNKRWEGVSFEDVVKRADAKEITEYILHNVMASAPQNLAFLSLAASGYGTAGLIGMGLISAADEAKRARDMGKDPAASTLNAAAVGTFEAAFERMGTLSFIEKWGGQLAKSFGKDTAFGIMKNVGKALVSSFVTEGSEELATSLSQDFSRYATGIDPNALKGSVWRGLGAFTVGGVAGTMMTTPATIATGLESAVTTINPETLSPETMAQLDQNLPAVSGFLKKIPTINVAPEKVNEAIITASVAKVEAISKGKSPEEAEIDSLHAFTKTLDPEPLVPQKKKAKGIIEYIKGWGGVDSTKEGGADFAELEIKGLVNDKNGKAPDHLVEKAIEDGFLPEQSTYNDLLALVEREQYSGPVLRQGDEAEGALPERPLDSMSIESLDREIDRFQDMLGQGKAGKSIQLRLADLLEARKRRAQAEAEDMPDWVTEPLEGLEPTASPSPDFIIGEKINGKEPWQMTKAEYRAAWDTPEFRAKFPNYKGDQDHGAQVADAVDTGKPVPPEVLADYPDLQSYAERQKIRTVTLNDGRMLEVKGSGEATYWRDTGDTTSPYAGKFVLASPAFRYQIESSQRRTPNQIQAKENLERLKNVNKVDDEDLIISMVDDIQADNEAYKEGYQQDFNPERMEIKGAYYPRGRGLKPAIEIASGGGTKTSYHEFEHFAWEHLYDDKQRAVMVDAFGEGQKAREDEAEAVALYLTEGTSGNSLVDKVFERVKQFLDRVKNWMKNNGFQNWQDLAKAIDQGKLGKRKSSRVLTPKDIQFSVEPKQIKEGRLRYKNPQKATAWLQSNGLYAAKEEVAPSGTNIAEDKNNVKPQFSVERRAPTFFSAAEVILKEKMPNVASVAQVRAILSGIKQEEVKWLGVEQFLEGKEKVSKADMLDFVRANQVKVEEVMKSDGYVKSRSGRITPMDNGLFRVEYPGLQDQVYKTMEEATDELDAVQSRLATEKKETKFKSYQLPGGENYRELLLTLPDKPDIELEAFKEKLSDKYPDGWSGKTLTAEENRIFDELEAKAEKTPNFRSSHFDEPNILAHVRFNERTGPKGERILFLEEVQSDWHQQGREKGYDTGGNEKLIARKDVNDYWVIETADGRFVTNVIHPEFTAEQAIAEGKRRLEEEPVRTGMDNRVPDAPFKKTWHELALKRILRFGAENGFDVLAWTPGEPQAERYDLSKHINVLYYKKNADGTYEVEGNIANEGGQHSFGESIPAEKLADFVGKDVASKITAGEGGYSKSHEMNFLKGADLKVGGEGMSGFYDLMLPSFLNKYAKKWGARVSDFRLNETASNPKWPIATEYAQGKKPVHSLDITPSMKRDVLEVGQIQFSVERKDEPQVGQAIKAISDSIKAKEVGGDYTLGDGEIIKAEDLVDSMTLGEVTKEKAAGFLKAVKKGIHFLELPQNYLYAHEDSKPVAEGVIDAFVARERREHDIEEFKRVALSAPNPEALAEIVAAADRDNDVNIFAELTKAVKAGKITQADKEAFTKGLYFIHKAAKDQLIRDILASRVGVRIKSMGTRYLASYETKDKKAQERWLTGTQMRALEARGTKITVLEEKEQIRIKRGSPEKGEIIESTRKVSSYDEALSILKEEEKQIIRELLPYRNYIPHARRGGRFWVEAYDQEGQKVYSARVPNESVAARMSELIGKEHPDWRIDAHPHSEKMRITPSFGSMADVQFFMNQNGIDPTSEPGQRIINAYRSVSPLMASLIHSQNIAGYKVDWDSIVDSMALMASSGSGRAYRLDVKDLMDDVKNIKDDFRFNTALQYVNALSEVQEDMPVVLQSIKSLTYFWLLANKSTYVIQNLTEPIWALARIESIKNPAGFAIVLNDEYKALLNRATEEGIFKPFFSEQALAMNPLENLQKLDILGRASEVWSSRKVFEIGLRLARDNGLRGNEAYRYAYQFLFNKGKPFYSTANKPIGMLGKGWAVNRQYGFMLLNFMFDWLGKFARGMLRNKLMTLMAWVLLGGFGTLPFGRKLMELFKFQFEKNARNYDLLDRFMLGGIAGMLGISPSFIVPTVLKGIPLPSVNPFRSIDIIGNQIGFAAKSYEKYGIVGAAGYLPLAGGQYILRGQARLKDGFKDNKKIIYRPRTNYEKLLVGAGLNPFEVNEYYRTKEDRR